MKRRWWISLLCVPAALLGLAWSAVYLLNSTEAGTRWLVDKAVNGVGDGLQIDRVQGSLESGLQLSGIRFEGDELTAELASLRAVADLTLLPPRVEIESLHADRLAVHRRAPGTGPGAPSASLEDVLATLRSPVPVEIEEAVVSDLQLFGADGKTTLHLDHLRLAGRWKDTLELDRLEIDTPGAQLNSSGYIALTPPHAHQLTLRGNLAETWLQAGASRSLDFALDLAGDGETTNLALTSPQLELDVSGPVEKPFADASFLIDVRVGRYSWPGEDPSSELHLKGLSGQLEGTVEDYRASLGAVVEGAGLDELRVELDARGGAEGLQISHLSAASENLRVNASGQVQWGGERVLVLDLEIQRVVPHVAGIEWPSENFVHGHASMIAVNESFELHDLDIRLAGTDTKIDGKVLWDPGAGVVDADLGWQGLSWPLGVDRPQWSSQNGSMQISGSPSDWQFEGELGFETELHHGGGLELQGRGGTDSADFLILNGQALGGSLTGKAHLDWQGPFKWNANLNLIQVNLGELFEDWPARLDANLAVFQDAGSDLFELVITSLGGEFRGQELSGSGALVFQNSEISFRDIQLNSGGAELAVNGGVAEPDGLDFALDVRRPGWMSDYLGGEIRGSGRFAPARPFPILHLELRGHKLQWGSLQIQDIEVTPAENLMAGETGLQIHAENVTFGTGGVGNLDALITGDENTQSLDIRIDTADHALIAKLEGAVADWTRLAEGGWSGQLAALSVESGQDVLLKLDAAVPLKISNTLIALGQSCLSVTGGGGLCAESSWKKGGLFEISASLSELELEASRLVYDHGLEFTQTLDGTFNWARMAGEYPSGGAAIRISPGQFGDRADEVGRISTGDGYFGFTLNQGNLVGGELDMPFPGVGNIDIDYAVDGLALDGTGRIEASVDVTLNNVSVLEQLAGGLEQISGQLDIDLKATGTTSDPHLDGLISLRNGAADVALLGTQLRQVDIEGRVSSNDMAQLQGRFKAGEGSGEFDLEAEFSDWMRPDVRLNLSGSSLRVLNTPNLRLDAGTDLHLGWAAGEWLVDGSILIDDAQLMPVTSFIGKVNESEDVRVVSGVRPYGQAEKVVRPVKVEGELEVTLGEKVEIRTEQARLALRGALSLTWTGGLVPVANGSIRTNGTLSLFGPQLHVKDGQVRFPGTSVDDPVLDIKAERGIYGNTQIRSAGVSILGRARRPEIEAYTNPYTTKDRAWALLITGSDVEYGQGVGAIEVGAYIAPRVYLSYGVSLFDDDNVISARYDLKKGFGIKASSGERDSGVDVSYTVDR